MSDIRLLTPDELAELFKLKRRTVMDTIARRPDFPKSVTGTQKPRWLYSDVVKFLRRKSAQTSHNA